MRLRLKSKVGVQTISPDINAPFSLLLEQIELIEELKPSGSGSIVAIKHGFPPQAVNMECGENDTIGSKGIKNGDQLILEYGEGDESNNNSNSNNNSITAAAASQKTDQKTGQKTSQAKSSDATAGPPSVELMSGSDLVLRSIPDDNSCLFNAIVHAVGSDTSPRELRTVVARHIQRNSQEYNAAILGRDVDSYCQWICKKDSWGGAIELGILADWFDVRIDCLDIESGQFISFHNEQKPPSKFIVLIYSGIHYDYLAETTMGVDITIWTVGADDFILEASKKLGDKLRSHNYATNTTKFRVRCLECYEVLVGETGASKHAEKTGHFNFGEVK